MTANLAQRNALFPPLEQQPDNCEESGMKKLRFSLKGLALPGARSTTVGQGTKHMSARRRLGLANTRCMALQPLFPRLASQALWCVHASDPQRTAVSYVPVLVVIKEHVVERCATMGWDVCQGQRAATLAWMMMKHGAHGGAHTAL